MQKLYVTANELKKGSSSKTSFLKFTVSALTVSHDLITSTLCLFLHEGRCLCRLLAATRRASLGDCLRTAVTRFRLDAQGPPRRRRRW